MASMTPSNAISWLLLMAIIINSLAVSNARGINVGVIDPCKRPGPLPPHCLPAGTDPHAKPVPANPWTRGCNPINRCRTGEPIGRIIVTPEVDFSAPAPF
ncbi:hypothetical protein ACOSQ2_001276 [Xanthoceras sorbifolium]